MLESVTPPHERAQLARRHLAARRSASARTVRQRIRLWGLQFVGRLLRARAARARGHRKRGWEAAWPKARSEYRTEHPSRERILVIRPDHLGDLLFATPALTRLRQLHPEAHIAALVGPWGQAVWAGNPDVDVILVCPFPGFTRRPKSSAWEPYRLLVEHAACLRAFGFDRAIILRFDHWWGAWLAAWAGVPIRSGYDLPEMRPFLTQAHAYCPGRHEVVQNLALVDPDLTPITPQIWPLRFFPTIEDERWADELVHSMGATGYRLIAIHPGSGAPVKAWRVQAWARVADALAAHHPTRLLLTGGPDERELAESVASAMRRPAVILAGETTLGQLAALLRRCALAMGPDSGPLHLAVAMGTPTVHLFGPVDARLFGPWGDPQRHRVLTSDWACIPCNRLDYPITARPQHGCVRDIAEEAVLETALELLAGG
ncbi:MAG: glycosyltransferase family 9 protein [Anaerolineae bacterium]|nr:glycosyltransferase family 9 protein [Anaerolineae bacterium]MDW8098773.1 glycosyltransferase family 9 protein [Anaerolineae bacterium]